ncbi:MAG: polysaccharide biosynthesis/export family protein [Pseudomonadota bacterium]
MLKTRGPACSGSANQVNALACCPPETQAGSATVSAAVLGVTRLGFTVLALVFAYVGVCGGADAADYKVNPGDLLGIDVWNEDELKREIRVRPDGAIALPIAGEINTTGLNPEQISAAIANSLRRYLRDEPRVVVSVLEASGNVVYVLGKVAKPGAYPIHADTDVMQALALAGGLTTFAAENEIRILRRSSDGTQIVFDFPYGRVKSGKSLASNVTLQSRDTVVVP